MTAQKRLLSIAAIIFLSAAAAQALDISISIVKHDHKHACKAVALASPHRMRHRTTVVHAPHSRRIICGPLGTRPWARRPLGHPMPWRYRTRAVHRHPCTRRPIPTATKLVIRSPLPTLTLWISNSNGSRTHVTLTRKGAGYVGPRGEYYPCRPTHRQLRVLYGF